MRRTLFVVVATALAAVTVVTLASASKTTTKVVVPQTVTPAGATGSAAKATSRTHVTRHFRIKNRDNVANLHVVWNAQWNPTNIAFSPEGQPICCANDLMVQTFIQGVVAVKPDTGETVWKYNGPESAQLTQQGAAVPEQHRAYPGVQHEAEHDLQRPAGRLDRRAEREDGRSGLDGSAHRRRHVRLVDRSDLGGHVELPAPCTAVHGLPAGQLCLPMKPSVQDGLVLPSASNNVPPQVVHPLLGQPG
jgi:hypothetical protein